MEYHDDQLSNMGLQLDNEARQQLSDIGKWAKFISIVVFSGCGLLLLIGSFAGSAMASVFKMKQFLTLFGEQTVLIFMAILIFVVGLVVAVYFFLFNFSVKVKQGLLAENTQMVNAGLKSLKIYFIITTVVAILSLLSTVYNAFAD